MDPNIVIALIGVGSAVVGSVITGLFLRRKNNADATRAITEAVNNILRPMNKRIDELERQVDRLEKKFATWLKGIKILVKQIEKHNEKPDWLPDELKEEK